MDWLVATLSECLFHPGVIHYPKRASALDLKEATAPGLCHSDVVFYVFLVTNIKTYPYQSSAEMLKPGFR